jgi:hypothetical protein
MKCYICDKPYNEGEIKEFLELEGEKYYFCEECLKAGAEAIAGENEKAETTAK